MFPPPYGSLAAPPSFGGGAITVLITVAGWTVAPGGGRGGGWAAARGRGCRGGGRNRCGRPAFAGGSRGSQGVPWRLAGDCNGWDCRGGGGWRPWREPGGRSGGRTGRSPWCGGRGVGWATAPDVAVVKGGRPPCLGGLSHRAVVVAVGGRPHGEVAAVAVDAAVAGGHRLRVAAVAAGWWGVAIGG